MTAFFTVPLFEQMPDRPSVHCATLTELPDGTLLSAWFAGSREMARDVVLMMARLEPGAQAWSAPQLLVEVPGRSLGQPIFLPHPNGELWFFFNVIMDAHWTSAQPYWQRSTDGGYSWQSAQPLMDYPGLMFRSKPFLLPGRIILPAYDETTWQSRMLLSDDAGQSWRITAPLTSPQGNIHPCIVQLADGRLMAYLRTGGKGGVIWRTESSDRGETWAEPTATELPNPNAGIDLIGLDSGALLLAYNPSAQRRTPLCVAWSSEDEHWPHQQTLEDADGEFSYPTLLQGTAGDIHLVYTHRRQHIQYARFDEAWVRAGTH
ncbi:MAG: exo-alpha-sialidase [Anaerolineae bacterium]|nr:exo-alpha-sialidase [Anaerolineae bacterium]